MSGRRGGGRRSRAIRGGDGISQLPWQEVVNTYAPMELLDEERIEALHRNSMRILSEIGIRVMSEKAMALFEKAGAIVDRENLMIRIDESIVEAALATTPSSFTLTSRKPEKRLRIGGNTIAFGLVAGPPNVHDRVNGRRQGNLADYQNFTRLAHTSTLSTFSGTRSARRWSCRPIPGTSIPTRRILRSAIFASTAPPSGGGGPWTAST